MTLRLSFAPPALFLHWATPTGQAAQPRLSADRPNIIAFLADDPNEKFDHAVKAPERVKQLAGRIIQQRRRDQASTGPSRR